MAGVSVLVDGVPLTWEAMIVRLRDRTGEGDDVAHPPVQFDVAEDMPDDAAAALSGFLRVHDVPHEVR